MLTQLCVFVKFLSERRLVSTYEKDETEEQEHAFQLVGSADRQDGGSPHVLEVYSVSAKHSQTTGAL